MWAAAARNLYQPVLLTAGAAFSFFASDKVETDSFSWNEWATSKFSKSDGAILNEAKGKEETKEKPMETAMEKAMEKAKEDSKATAKAKTTPTAPTAPKTPTETKKTVDGA